MENFQKQFILALLAYAVKRDLDAQTLCTDSGITYKKLSRVSNFKITPFQINQLWKNASQLSKDSYFGLHFGESAQLNALGAIGQLIEVSDTIGEALSHAGALTHLITDMFTIKIEHAKKSFTVHLVFDKNKAAEFPLTFKHMADYLIVFIIHEMDSLLLQKKEPLSVTLPYAITEHYEYTRVLRCSKIKKGNDLQIEFPNSYLRIPIVSADYKMQKLLLQKMDLLLRKGSLDATMQNKIYNYLITNSYIFSLTLEAVAANFNMHARTIQRKLKEEGITYLEIVEEVRKTLAINYLNEKEMSIKEISHILGYNEQSAFFRAFKRWTNSTPAKYKNKR